MGTPFIPAKYYHAGRIAPVDLLVLHTAEGATTAAALGRYFQAPSAPSSSHYGVSDTDEAGYVRYDDTAWAAPGANADGEQLELCGFAAWTRQQWLTEHSPMLDRAARWVAGRAAARKIPLVLLGPAELLAGHRGVTTHAAVSAAWHLSDHTDPGAGCPLDVILARAAAIQLARPRPLPARKTPPPVHVYPIVPKLPRTLRIGCRGTDVLAAQRRLAHRGWTITCDGIYGRQTAGVVAAYQREKHLTVDGVLGPQTWRSMWLAPITVTAPPATMPPPPPAAVAG